MTPAQDLLLAAVVLYLFECLLVLPRSQVLFWSMGFARFKVRLLENLPGSPTKAFYLAMPFPPLGEFLLSEPWPFSISPEGIDRGTSQHVGSGLPEAPDENGFVAMADVQRVTRAGAMIRLNGTDFVACGCERSAEVLAALISKLAKMPHHKREARIEKAMWESLDSKAVRAALDESRSASRTSRIAGNLLFVFMFVVCPAVAWAKGLANTWWQLGAALLLLWVFAVVEFWLTHKSLRRDARVERRKIAFVHGLTPVGAARLADHATRDVLAAWHPLAITHAVSDEMTFQRIAALAYRDLCHPLIADDETRSEDAVQTVTWFRKRLKAVLEQFLKRSNLEPFEMLAAPEPEDDSTRAYCPRCRLQYTIASGDCASCPGVPLVLFDRE